MINPRSFPAAILTSTPPISSALRYWKARRARSEEHTSELQSRSDLVCRLLLEKKKKHILPHDLVLLDQKIADRLPVISGATQTGSCIKQLVVAGLTTHYDDHLTVLFAFRPIVV